MLVRATPRGASAMRNVARPLMAVPTRQVGRRNENAYRRQRRRGITSIASSTGVKARCSLPVVSSQPRRTFMDASDVGEEQPSLIAVPLPALSPTMNTGVLKQWYKKEGDEVAAGDILFELETDKTTMEVESVEDGYLAKILFEASDDPIPVGAVIGVMVEEKADIERVVVPAEMLSLPLGDTREVSSPTVVPSASDASATKLAPPIMPPGGSVEPDGATLSNRFSPGARSALLAAGYEPATTFVLPSGKNGLVLKGDVVFFLAGGGGGPSGDRAQSQAEARSMDNSATRASASSASSASSGVSGSLAGGAGAGGAAASASTNVAPRSDAPYTEIPLSNIRHIIASRLSESKQKSPHMYVGGKCSLNKVDRLRAQLREDGVKVSVNDFVVRAAAAALRAVPELNLNKNSNGDFEQMSTVDVSVAVATENGLITPILTNADGQTVRSINAKIKDLAGRARANKLAPHEFQGGTFTISNLGMFGVSHFTAVINPPQACILAVGTSEVTLHKNTETRALEERTTMKFTLSCDRSAVDEADAARWIEAFVRYLEDPTQIVLG